MCYICSCFAWGLDLLQRLITFGLACMLSGAICIGLIVAVVAGIAYGYNYSMAEFVTFTRSDVTVYMKRGQFYDPKRTNEFRRSGGDTEEDMFAANLTADYEDHKPPAESKPLADTWLKTQDTRKYAEILTKYNPTNLGSGHEPEPQPLPPPPVTEKPIIQFQPGGIRFRPTVDTPVISIVPNPLIPTVAWRSGSSEIMMRNFQPMHDYTSARKFTETPGTLFPTIPNSEIPQSISLLDTKEQAKSAVDDKLRDDFRKSYVPMRVWGTTRRPVIPEDTEDIDEDNIVYKPV